ncbi:N-acetylglucosaminyl phosphatidylinositol deacetylase-related protein [Desulfonema limicola]|uniref:N-acetylglucosaminyl phosphatidylinositol deacetylase-related protein n=1 Tax=Desulfonema limicola TaxID=45656 RepID=A0A975B636_9BACT|nr:PIG-L family deacetylase [Desulfonema limicola]QTA79489.1 N-acetylglucosaminyl phosphatidylinositol deacetylase-related protein [Desulfonema limicola]
MIKTNILAIGAHPDDIEFGCGGTLVKFGDKGHRLFMLVMTSGGSGGIPETRKKEQEDAQAVMGVEKVFWGGYEDTMLEINKDTIMTIENIIKEINPSFIFCSYPDDTHQDHRHLARAAISATRYVRNVLFYEGPTTQNFNPHVFVDISEMLEKKMDALKAHKSQVMRTNIADLSILELARSAANFRGIQGRVKYAEAFHSQRLFINI